MCTFVKSTTPSTHQVRKITSINAVIDIIDGSNLLVVQICENIDGLDSVPKGKTQNTKADCKRNSYNPCVFIQYLFLDRFIEPVFKSLLICKYMNGVDVLRQCVHQLDIRLFVPASLQRPGSITVVK